MTYKPILFNTEMVQAVQAGRKTQTRRILKTRHGGKLEMHDDPGGVSRLCEKHGSICHGLIPPFNPGDILWVRETWCENKNPNSQNFGGYEYRADYEGALCQDLITWRPSIHMPKEAARIFLRVKDVRVERLREISEADCAAEGIMEFTKDGKLFKYGTLSGDMSTIPWQDMPVTPGHAFASLWDSTIKPADRDEYGWNANPWVWVIEFERCGKPEGWCT